MQQHLLIVDDEPDMLSLLKRSLAPELDCRVDTAASGEAALEKIGTSDYDLVLADIKMPGLDGLEMLRRLREADQDTVVIVMTGYASVSSAVEVMKMGALDYLPKPFTPDELRAIVRQAVAEREIQLQNRKLQQQIKKSTPLSHQLIGNSPKIKQVISMIQKVAPTDSTVLVHGESGTGKELVARAVHANSRRSKEVFFAVDCGTLSSNLLESELFGYMKGAFTDAKENRPGRFELADGGTLFLDEIGNLSLAMQAKLLSVLETRKVTRLGSNKPRDIDIRLICATNMPIYDMVAKNDFRQDLLYRINTVEVNLPPLRERQEDIPLLVDHFLAIFSKKYKKDITGISASALKKLQRYHWPGNIRELIHTLERAVILSESKMLQPADFLFPEAGKDVEGVVFENYNLEEVEKTVIRKTLKKHDGNISHAAKELGLTRTSLYRRMDKYRL